MTSEDYLNNIRSYFEPVESSDNSSFKCLLCNSHLSGDFENLKDHIRCLHPELAGKYESSFGRPPIKDEFQTSDNVRKYYEPIDKRLFKCRLCNQERRGTFNHFKRHIWTMHKDSIDFDMEEPEPVKDDDEEEMSKEYRKYYEPIEKRLFKCRLCNQERRGTFNHFKRHIWAMHKDSGFDIEEPETLEDDEDLNIQNFLVNHDESQEYQESFQDSGETSFNELSSDSTTKKALKSFFLDLKQSEKPMFRCLICSKELCGSFTNFKDHMWSAHREAAISAGMQPPKKKVKGGKGPEKVSESPKRTYDRGGDIKNYFQIMRNSAKTMFKCLLCNKELCGTFNNFKDHLWSLHNDFAKQFGVEKREKKRKRESYSMVKAEVGDTEEESNHELSKKHQDSLSETSDTQKSTRKRKFDQIKQEGEGDGTSGDEELHDSLKSYFEIVKGSPKSMFRCLMCTKTLCGNFANFRQHVWAVHQEEALKHKMERPKMRVRSSSFTRPQRNFGMFDSVEYRESSPEPEKICRLCEGRQELSSIFNKKKGKCISEMVLEVVPEIHITRYDGFSQDICKDCVEIVVSACELRSKSIQIDKKLRSEPEETFFRDESSDYFNPLEFSVKAEPVETPLVTDTSFKIVETFHVKEEFVDVASKVVNVTLQESHVCKACDKTFTDISSLSRHKCQFSETFKCDICELDGDVRTFSSKSKLEQHMTTNHVDSQLTDVEKSLRLYFEPDRSTSRRLFRCLMCDKQLSGTFTNFKCHMWSCHNQASRAFGLEEPRKGLSEKTDDERQFSGDFDGLRSYYEAVKSSTKRMFRCLMCGKELCGAYANFRQHIWSSHNKEGLEFGLTAPSMKQKLAAARNSKLAAGISDEHECDYCGKIYKSFYSCHMHKKRDHAEIIYPFPCNLCDKRYETKSKLEDHVFVFHENLKCKICKLQFESRQAYNLHSYIHCDYVEEFIDPNQKYDCSLCAFMCDTDEVLQGHLVTHANDFYEKTFMVCIRCSQQFQNFEELVNHTNEHNLRITHRCLKCNKVFPFSDKLLRHLKRYSESYFCDYCGHCDSGKTRLEEHMKVKHFKLICFLCPFCGESKASRHSLTNHIRTMHEMEKKFKCDKCPKAFSSAAFYRNHQSVHTNIKNFVCSNCPKTFKSLRNLKRHQMFHDPSKLKYKYFCDYDNCGKKFYTNYGKNRHMLTHTGIRPWVCDFEGCDRSFSQSQDLNKHRRLHVGSECTYACDYEGCTMAFKYVQDLRLHLGVHYQQKN